ncbi:coiled coils domain protein [Faustovirus]|nr:coiled coils domain protein [Faustovirus]
MSIPNTTTGHGDLVEYEITVKHDANDRFVYSWGKYILKASATKRKSATRWWEVLCFRGGLRSYHIRVIGGQIHFKMIRKFGRVDPIKSFINMLIANNGPWISEVLEMTWCEADNCTYALNKFLLYCEHGNPEGMIVWRNKMGRRCRKLISVDTGMIPLFAHMATRQLVRMRPPQAKPTATTLPTILTPHTGKKGICERCASGQCKTKPMPMPMPVQDETFKMRAVKTNLTAQPSGAAGPILNPVQLQQLRTRVNALRDQLENGTIEKSDLVVKLRDLAIDATKK